MMNSGARENEQRGANAAVTARASEQDVPEAALGLLRALRNTGVSVFYQDTDLQVVWAQNVPTGWSPRSIVGMTDPDFLPSRSPNASSPRKARACWPPQAGAAGNQRARFRKARRWFDLWIDADCDADGSVRGVITTAVETTEQKRREQTLRALLREVSHRSKNLAGDHPEHRHADRAAIRSTSTDS